MSALCSPMRRRGQRSITSAMIERLARSRLSAFIDSGKQLDIRDWRNESGQRQCGSEARFSKMGEGNRQKPNGSDDYKETVARLAAENGYKITNPELQDRIRELRAKIEAQRATITEGNARTETKEADMPVKSAPVRRQHQSPADPRGLNTTPAERTIELNSIANGSTPRPNEKPVRRHAGGKLTKPTPQPAQKGYLSRSRRSPRGT